MRRRRSREAGEVPVASPRPRVDGAGGVVPEPRPPHPGEAVSHAFAGPPPEELCARIGTRAHRCVAPTEAAMGRWGRRDVFACPDGPERPHPSGRPAGSCSAVPQPARAG
ncbi:hypothetical protein GCM10010249_13790 [Streptomyces roseolilacinus]|uniref:Uncharacterized protein n=1 Tax=Streptomyces roseolilacinus TaxID=66904 RepID=A0A918AXB9_9ACTN|nr:hypothetical protein GCM10010249_13790 [Streptomyces roseolilacinus]